METIMLGGAQLLLTAALLVANAAKPGEDCQCFCTDGVWRTLCSSVEAAQREVDRCGLRAPGSCPALPQPPVPREYPAPVDDAVHCRDLQVFDAAGAHGPVKVCDVVPAA